MRPPVYLSYKGLARFIHSLKVYHLYKSFVTLSKNLSLYPEVTQDTPPSYNTAYPQVGCLVHFEKSLLSITFRAGGQKRCKPAPPAGMQETLAVIV